MRIETDRLLLREMTSDDFHSLYQIFSDPETMQHYPAVFDADKVRNWIQWNRNNYREHGFGLYGVVWKETGDLIGDCGMTLQTIDGKLLPEIGYHIHRQYWKRGIGSEAAKAVRDWAFVHTEFDCLYSYMKHTNEASRATARSMGMRMIKEYSDPRNNITVVYAMTRSEWMVQTGQ